MDIFLENLHSILLIQRGADQVQLDAPEQSESSDDFMMSGLRLAPR